MDVRPGYEQTEVGVIPEDWEVRRLAEVGSTYGGLTGKSKADFGLGNGRYVSFMNVMTNVVIDTEMFEQVRVSPGESQNRVCKGDLLFNGSSETPEEVAMCSFMAHDVPNLFLNSFCFGFRLQDSRQADGRFLAYYLRANPGRELMKLLAQGSTRYNLSKRALLAASISLPPLPEQRAIAAALSDVDALLGGLERLIAKKRDLKQAAMRQLLTGQTRLPGFSGAWEVKRIGDLASMSSEKNSAGETLPVLACSKHFGFMDSIGFFKNQVFSKNLSAYKVIRRDEIGYPANHIEEGSIGLQDLYDTALVSPIYVVFTVAAHISSFFLHRLLKLDSYRQRFRVATTSSVDRRGSLRWPAFSDITVSLPPTKEEQTAIAAVVSAMDAELAALEARRDKTRDLKQAMMQELLTGRTRLVEPAPRREAAC